MITTVGQIKVDDRVRTTVMTPDGPQQHTGVVKLINKKGRRRYLYLNDGKYIKANVEQTIEKLNG